MQSTKDQETALCTTLLHFPYTYSNRYDTAASTALTSTLFRSLAANNDTYLRLLFPHGPPPDRSRPWSLKDAQGHDAGPEYGPAAKGTACGHIFKAGESTYSCKTCAADDTCVLCARCFESSEHEGHSVFVSVSPGNSGCCDCGDPEAWRREVVCGIHSLDAPEPTEQQAGSTASGGGGGSGGGKGKGKESAAEGQGSDLPPDLVESIRLTIARALDYLLDVLSCSPEQLRLPKTHASILTDEHHARLAGPYGPEPAPDDVEYALILWNDEKHTVDDVQNQVARACAKTKRFGLEKAMEVNDIGRSVIAYSTNLPELLEMARVIEQIKVTVTIRSARDTFREAMCEGIIAWIADISGCSVGTDAHILRRTVCEELLRPWRWGGSKAGNLGVGERGLDDHEMEDNERLRRRWRTFMQPFQVQAGGQAGVIRVEIDGDGEEEEEDEDEGGVAGDDGILDEEDEDEEFDDAMEDAELGDDGGGDGGGMEMDLHDFIDAARRARERGAENTAREARVLDEGGGPGGEMEIDFQDLDDNEDVTEALEATLAGYPPPPPPPPHQGTGGRRSSRHEQRDVTPADSDADAEGTATPSAPEPSTQRANRETGPSLTHIPKTPKVKGALPRKTKASRHWLAKPSTFSGPRPADPAEDLFQRVRLDYLILYDLRLWKTLRTDLRHLYITTVVTLPHFKRVLGLRYAGLYTALAQLYLIADREPDHSIINLSVQMLTTPSITEEVVARGNFLSNLMAILYTFLTTRQVGFPADVNPRATLSFESGAVTNRRIFHFFVDLRWMFGSSYVQKCLREESERYVLQFADLVKLVQGVCPNVRKRGEHVEFESDGWICASMVVKEVDRLCRMVGAAFDVLGGEGEEGEGKDGGEGEKQERLEQLRRALRMVGQVVMIHAFGYERRRFVQAELRDEMAWHTIGPFTFAAAGEEQEGKTYSVPRFEVQREPMSFHHPLHYLLSWLLEDAKPLPREEVRALLHFQSADLRDPWNPALALRAITPPNTLTSDELLSAIFEHPLRTYVWLSQMKAGMWVRNGITLRHQAHTYKSVGHRDVGYQRDLLLMQAGFVLCGAEAGSEEPGERYLAQVIDRFEMTGWMQGHYGVVDGFEEGQQMDVLEDLYHLLVICLTERGNLLVPGSKAEKQEQERRVMQREIAHALCFKPLSFSDLNGRVTERVLDSDTFSAVLEEMTNYRPPEGLSDTGVFELKPEFLERVDPFWAHYSRNHREEAEGVLRKHLARKAGKPAEEVVIEPRLERIETGLFRDLAGFTRTKLFGQVIGAALKFAVEWRERGGSSTVQVSRVETLLGMVLHLVMLATMEDEDGTGFVKVAAKTNGRSESAVSLLVRLLGMEEYAACHPTIKHVLRKMQLAQPEQVGNMMGPLGALLDRTDTGSPASLNADEKEKKKAEALARQARVMAKMKEQQNSFMQNQGMSAFGGEDFEDLDADDADGMSITADEPENLVEKRKTWEFPSGTCILCQEEADDRRLFGTFAFLGESGIVRATPTEDEDFVREVMETPPNLDRSAEGIRPFGVAGRNKQTVQKTTAEGKVVETERHGLSKGFPPSYAGEKCFQGPVSTSCGHIMHYSCFELYTTATQRRHQQQIARTHPERLECKEFICPLCKALGNTFLPIIWKSKECAYEHELHAAPGFAEWLVQVPGRYEADLSFLENAAPAALLRQQQVQDALSGRSSQYVQKTFSPALVANMQELSFEQHAPNSAGAGGQSSQRRYSLRRGYSLSSLFRLGSSSNSSGDSSGLSPQQGEQAPPRMAELVKAYHRVDETIKANRLCAPGKSLDWDRVVDRYTSSLLSNRGLLEASDQFDRGLTGGRPPAPPPSTSQSEDGAVNPVVPLIRALGMSVSAFEIAHRGSGNPTATSLLSELTEQSLTHLRILSETIESFLAVNVLRNPSTNPVARETVKKRDIMTAQLFGVESELAMIKLKDHGSKLLFQDDVFLFFADWIGFMAPDVAEASEVLQLCYWAEITKAVFVYKQIVKQADVSGVMSEAQVPVSEAFKLAVSGMALEDTRDPYSRVPLSEGQMQMLRLVVEKYAMTFLRKTIVLMHVRYGLDFECPYNVDVEAPEIERLSALLHMPSLDELCTLYTSHGAGNDNLRLMTKRWIAQANMVSEHESTGQASIHIPHPAIFELVGLPKTYDALTQEAMRRKCPTTGKELTDPAICLFCGEIFCSQAVCCMKEKSHGGCYQHMDKCGGQIGLFINIRKCMVLFRHGALNGSWAHAPYLDKHGETDPTLRRHHQLFLNQRRYDKLYRDTWLNHMVPTVISRKLEADINPGGWNTL